MDATLTELAMSGARAIVQLMASDAWQNTKKLVTKLFSSRSDRAQEEMAADLEASRMKITAGDAIDPKVQEYEQDRWEAVLRLRLLEEPEVAEVIAAILDLAQSKQLGGIGGTAPIVMKAETHDNSRVYQQGSGIQHNG
jgi:hypothetical protein